MANKFISLFGWHFLQVGIIQGREHLFEIEMQEMKCKAPKNVPTSQQQQ